jgi:hypothetical protein
MRLVYTDIALINAGDIEMSSRYAICEEEIRRMPFNLLINHGS